MDKRRKALFFGDSNTYGYDPAGFMGGRYPRAQRWTTILQEELVQEWEIAADGMPGRALSMNRYEWDFLGSLIRREMPFDLFAVMLGSNDLLGTLHPDAAKTAEKMKDLIAFVRDVTGQAARECVPDLPDWPPEDPASLDPDARDSGAPDRSAADGNAPDRKNPGQTIPGFLLIAPPKILLREQSYMASYVAGDRTYAQIYEREGRKLSQYYRELAEDRQTSFADASQWELEFAWDGVHLSENGHAAFAAHMAEVLRAL